MKSEVGISPFFLLLGPDISDSGEAGKKCKHKTLQTYKHRAYAMQDAKVSVHN